MSTRRREDYRLGPSVDPSKTWTSSDRQRPPPSEYDATTIRRRQRSQTTDESKGHSTQDARQYDARPPQHNSSRTHRSTQDSHQTHTSGPTPSSSQPAASSSRVAQHGSQTVRYASSSNPYATQGQSTSQAHSHPHASTFTNATHSRSSRSRPEAYDSTIRSHRRTATTTAQHTLPEQTTITDDFGRTIRVKPPSRGTAQVTSQAFWTPPTEDEIGPSRQRKERDSDRERDKERDRPKGAYQEKEKVKSKASDPPTERDRTKSELDRERGKRQVDRSRTRDREDRPKEHDWEERLRERERDINRSKRSMRQAGSDNEGAVLQDYQNTLKPSTIKASYAPPARGVPSSSNHRRYRTEDGTAPTATNHHSREPADQPVSNAPVTASQIAPAPSGAREGELPPPAPRFMPVYLPTKSKKSQDAHHDKYASQGGQSGSDTERASIKHRPDKISSNPTGYQSDGYTSGYASGHTSGKERSQRRNETQPESRSKRESKYAPKPQQVPVSPPLITPGFMSASLPSDNIAARMNGPQLVSIRAGEGPADYQSHSTLHKLQATLRHEALPDYAPRILPTPAPSGTVRDQRSEEATRGRAELPSFSRLRSESVRPSTSSPQVPVPVRHQTDPTSSRSQAYSGPSILSPTAPPKAPEQRDSPPRSAPNTQHFQDVYPPFNGVSEPVIPSAKYTDTQNVNTQPTRLPSRVAHGPSYSIPQPTAQHTAPTSIFPQPHAYANNLSNIVSPPPARAPTRYEHRPSPPTAMPMQAEPAPARPKRVNAYEPNTQDTTTRSGRQYVPEPLGFQSSRSTTHSSPHQQGSDSAKAPAPMDGSSSRHTSPHSLAQQHPASQHSTPSHDTPARLSASASSMSRKDSRQYTGQNAPPPSNPDRWSPHQIATAVDDRKVTSTKMQDGPIQATWEVHAKHKLPGSNKESVVVGSLSVTNNAQQHVAPGTHPQLREILSNPPSSSTSPKNYGQEAGSSPHHSAPTGAELHQGAHTLPHISVIKATPGTATKDLPREADTSFLLPAVPPIPRPSTRNEARNQPGITTQGVTSQSMSRPTDSQSSRADENTAGQSTVSHGGAPFSQVPPAYVDPRTTAGGTGNGIQRHDRRGLDGTSGFPSQAFNAPTASYKLSPPTQANHPPTDSAQKNRVYADPYNSKVDHPKKPSGVKAYVEEVTDDEMPARPRNPELASVSKTNPPEVYIPVQSAHTDKMSPPPTEAAAYAEYITQSFAAQRPSPDAPAPSTSYMSTSAPPNALRQVPQSAPASQTAFQGYLTPTHSQSTVQDALNSTTVKERPAEPANYSSAPDISSRSAQPAGNAQATNPATHNTTRSVTSPPVLASRSAAQSSSKHANTFDKYKKTSNRAAAGNTVTSATLSKSNSRSHRDGTAPEESSRHTKGSATKSQANPYEPLRSAPLQPARTNVPEGYPHSTRPGMSTQQPSYPSVSAHQRSVSVPVTQTNALNAPRPSSPVKQPQVTFPSSSSSKPGTSNKAQGTDKSTSQIPAPATDGKLQVPLQVSRTTSNESDPLLTPSSISPPTPTAAQPDTRQRTTSTESKERKKQSFFGLFRSRSKSQDKRAEQAAPATTKAQPAARATEKLKPGATVAQYSRKPSDPKQLLTVPEPSHRSHPLRERKESLSNVFSPFKFLSSKRDRTMSSASLEALDGNTNATNTVIGSPTHSQVSQVPPITLPPARDPMTATSEWRDREEYQRSRGRKANRILRPGVTFDVAEDLPQKVPEKPAEKLAEQSSSNGKQKGSKLVRRNTGREKSRPS